MDKLKMIQQIAWIVIYMSISAMLLTMTTLLVWNMIFR